jgi:Protein of unknown function (DUF3228)
MKSLPPFVVALTFGRYSSIVNSLNSRNFNYWSPPSSAKTNLSWISSTLQAKRIANKVKASSVEQQSFSAIQNARMSSSSSDNNNSSGSSKKIVVDPFCFRQFVETEASKAYGGSVFDITIAEFEEIVNARYAADQLQDGYAPFCKHVFLVNDFLPNAFLNVLPITPNNEHLLRTKYESRNEKELPVLARYFPNELIRDDKVHLPTAKFFDLILYSREQIQKQRRGVSSVLRHKILIVNYQ